MRAVLSVPAPVVVITGAYLLNSEYVFKRGANPMDGHGHKQEEKQDGIQDSLIEAIRFITIYRTRKKGTII